MNKLTALETLRSITKKDGTLDKRFFGTHKQDTAVKIDNLYGRWSFGAGASLDDMPTTNYRLKCLRRIIRTTELKELLRESLNYLHGDLSCGAGCEKLKARISKAIRSGT